MTIVGYVVYITHIAGGTHEDSDIKPERQEINRQSIFAANKQSLFKAQLEELGRISLSKDSRIFVCLVKGLVHLF